MLKCFTQALSRWIAVTAIALLALPAIALPAQATSLYQLPPSIDDSTWVVDEANQITRLNEGKLRSQFQSLAEQTGNEVRVVTIHRLDYGETPQTYADRLFGRWFPTPEAQANQTVIVLDDVTNDAGIRVGDAAAELLTPEIAESISQETIKVPLRRNNSYNQAFLDTADRLVAVLSGEADPGPPQAEETINTEGTFATAEETEENRSNSTVVVIVLLVLATVIPMATYYWYLSIGG
ncbi:MAG: YgcG family protein [Leptolyngbya sp. SIO4C1]|nr:YgcG family protein [Leptolyngbya sp. SIO4C1]